MEELVRAPIAETKAECGEQADKILDKLVQPGEGETTLKFRRHLSGADAIAAVERLAASAQTASSEARLAKTLQLFVEDFRGFWSRREHARIQMAVGEKALPPWAFEPVEGLPPRKQWAARLAQVLGDARDEEVKQLVSQMRDSHEERRFQEAKQLMADLFRKEPGGNAISDLIVEFAGLNGV